MTRLRRANAAAVFVFLAAAAGASAPPVRPTPAGLFDASRVLPGRFVYRIARQGEEFARFTLTIRRLTDGNYEFTGQASGFDQRWESIATQAFEPIRAALRMGKAGSYSMLHLDYADGFATGTDARSADRPAAGGTEATPLETPIRGRVPAGTVDQRVDWAAMLSCGLTSGQTLEFHVYDPKTGVSRVEGSWAGEATTTVPAGTYETVAFDYRIHKKTGVEAYRVYATRTLPRMMVREDFPNGEVTDLLEASPDGGPPKH